jgi:hypothetical protein
MKIMKRLRKYRHSLKLIRLLIRRNMMLTKQSLKVEMKLKIAKKKDRLPQYLFKRQPLLKKSTLLHLLKHPLKKKNLLPKLQLRSLR